MWNPCLNSQTDLEAFNRAKLCWIVRVCVCTLINSTPNSSSVCSSEYPFDIKIIPMVKLIHKQDYDKPLKAKNIAFQTIKCRVGIQFGFYLNLSPKKQHGLTLPKKNKKKKFIVWQITRREAEILKKSIRFSHTKSSVRKQAKKVP